MVLWLNFSGVVLALVQVRFSGYAASFWWLPRVLGSNAAVNADGFAAGYFGSLEIKIYMCPICSEPINVAQLLEHCLTVHGRAPTEGEMYRARHPQSKKKKNVKPSGKSIRAVSGGLPSLGKR